jgi:hypothetical protein
MRSWPPELSAFIQLSGSKDSSTVKKAASPDKIQDEDCWKKGACEIGLNVLNVLQEVLSSLTWISIQFNP